MALDLDSLNPAQLNAVEHGAGPAVVIAGAGSGKTRVLTYRIAKLIQNGVPAAKILACTFTRKAAGEMQERLADLVGAAVEELTVGTIHSLCFRILREEWANQGLRYETLDESQQKRYIREILAPRTASNPWGLNLDVDAGTVLATISRLKNDLVTPDELARWIDDGEAPWRMRDVLAVYRQYERRKDQERKLDFDDMLLWCYQLLSENPAVLRKWQRRFEHVLVDEFQDTNMAQWEILRMLAAPENNLFVVGDDWQCWSGDAVVLTLLDGPKRVADLEVGDYVQSVVNGRPQFVQLTAKSEPQMAPCVEVVTRGGRRLKVTPNHLCFATLPDLRSGWYLYLMYRRDKGFRLGVTRGGLQGLIGARTHPERPEMVWFLDRSEDPASAGLLEQQLSLRYGVPTVPYFHNGRGIRLSQKHLDQLFDEFGQNGFALLEEKGQIFGCPHFVPKGSGRSGGKAAARPSVYLYMNAGKGRCLVSYECGGMRLRRVFSGKDAYRSALRVASQISCEQNAQVVERYVHQPRVHLAVVPASSLLPTMKIPVVDGGRMELDEVMEVRPVVDPTMVYHLEAAETGIVVANEIASHNSIYGWRGAHPELIVNFRQHYPDAVVYVLDLNYRSTEPIVALGNRVIAANTMQFPKKLKAHRGTGHEPYLLQALDEDHEAEIVVREIRALRAEGWAWKDIAILYRTNAQSRAFEDVLVHENIPYCIVGATGFYKRKEVKDLVAYLRVVADPGDEEAVKRVLNVPSRYLGQAFIRDVEEYARRTGCTFYRALTRTPGLKPYQLRGAQQFVEIIGTVQAEEYRPAAAIRMIRDMTDYDKYVRQDAEDADDDRIANLDALEQAAAKFPDIPSFLRYVAMMEGRDTEAAGDRVQLLSIHRAKGLEWPVVFVAGVSDGLLPHARAESVEEERRLCYVAVTRAKDRLFLSVLNSYRGRPVEPSPFLAEAGILVAT